MKKIILMSLMVLLISGCSTTPKIEDYTNNPDGMWQEGKKLSEKGEKLIIKGEKALEDARTELREGEAYIQSGTERILRARQDYQATSLQIGSSTSPKEVEFEANKLNAIGERWEDAVNDVKKGNAKMAKSKTMQIKAHDQIKEGRELVENGSSFIRNSQQLKMNSTLTVAPSNNS